MARAFGLPDQPGRSTMDTLTRFIADRQMLVVLDNCEHLLDASAALVDGTAGRRCPGLTFLATSREPIGVAGEVSWRVPSLSLADEAIELFTDRARHARPEFAVTDDNVATVARDLHAPRRLAAGDRAGGGAGAGPVADRDPRQPARPVPVIDRRRAHRGTPPADTARLGRLVARAADRAERVLFRRLAAFLGGFDLDAAQAVAGGGDMQRYQVLDLLTLLVDKSLVVADDSRGRTRYRLLETVRQYALEKLGESGEADDVRSRHRDHYTAMAALLDAPAGSDYEQRLEQAETEIDNLRAAFAWSRENSDARAGVGVGIVAAAAVAAAGPHRKGWPGSTSSSDEAAQHPDWRPLCVPGRWPTGPCLPPISVAADRLDQAHQALAHRASAR